MSNPTPGIPNYWPPILRQLDGSEFSGVQCTVAGGIQPKDPELLTAGEQLRLGYITGQDESTDLRTNIDDKRQMLGLRPAEGRRPLWLDGVSDDDDSRLESEARRQGFGQ